MGRLGQRILGAVLVLIAVSMLTFGAMNVLGDPLFNLLGPVAGAADARGTATVDGYAVSTAGTVPTGPLTVVVSADRLGLDEALEVSVGDLLPTRADTVVPLSATTVNDQSVTIDATLVLPGLGVQNGPEPGQLADVIAAEREFYLDDPLPVRYVRWLADFVSGDMGPQFSKTGEPPVTDLIKERLPRSLMLLVMAQFLAALIAIPWALWSASKANSAIDRASTIGTFLIIAMPNFAFAIVLKYIFAIKLDWLPQTFNAQDPLLDRTWQMLLPALTLALPAAAVYQRLLRTDLITTLQEDFILMARSKGVSRRRVLFKHALRPSLFSFITVFGLTTGALIGGALVVENIFRIPGLGQAIVEAVLVEDFPVVLAIVMIVAATFVVVNIAVDIVYTLIDPRVRT